MRKKALVTGVTGQDGAYLTKHLLSEGYEVIGVARNLNSESKWRLKKLGISDSKGLQIVKCDITKTSEVESLVGEATPAEIYNLASHSFVADPKLSAIQTTAVTGLGALNFLHSIEKVSKETRFLQAGSSEMFGESPYHPQDEDSVFRPRNVYGSAKVFAHLVSQNYKLSSGVFAATTILFNHESPLRSVEFVTRKITRAVAEIKLHHRTSIQIGNLGACRDFGYAPEYVDAMVKVLRHDHPDNFVVATGITTTIREFVTTAFDCVGVQLRFEGSGLEEKGFDNRTGRELVSVSPDYYRPDETFTLVGNPNKAQRILGWKSKVPVQEVISAMVSDDLESLRAD